MPYFESGETSVYYRTTGAGSTGLVFIHGWYQTGSEAWIALARNLKPGFKLFMPDLPGHGLSDDVSPQFSIATNAQLIEGFIEHARKTYRLKKVVLVGHSYGAFATLDVAARQNVVLDALVAISAVDDYAPYVKRLKHALWVPAFLAGIYYRIQALLALFLMATACIFMAACQSRCNRANSHMVQSKTIRSALRIHAHTCEHF
jgi:pimeloyl-ACP methyl ester carboxylesterase